MPDESFIGDRRQQLALAQLNKRLREEQLAFDPGDPEYDEYQTKLDSVTSKNEALAQARLLARPVHTSPPVRA